MADIPSIDDLENAASFSGISETPKNSEAISSAEVNKEGIEGNVAELGQDAKAYNPGEVLELPAGSELPPQVQGELEDVDKEIEELTRETRERIRLLNAENPVDEENGSNESFEQEEPGVEKGPGIKADAVFENGKWYTKDEDGNFTVERNEQQAEEEFTKFYKEKFEQELRDRGASEEDVKRGSEWFDSVSKEQFTQEQAKNAEESVNSAYQKFYEYFNSKFNENPNVGKWEEWLKNNLGIDDETWEAIKDSVLGAGGDPEKFDSKEDLQAAARIAVTVAIRLAAITLRAVAKKVGKDSPFAGEVIKELTNESEKFAINLIGGNVKGSLGNDIARFVAEEYSKRVAQKEQEAEQAHVA